VESGLPTECLVEAIEAVLFASDPVGIIRGTNTREYRPEARMIVDKLLSDGLVTNDGVVELVYATFVEMFASAAGPRSAYERIAEDVAALARTALPR